MAIGTGAGMWEGKQSGERRDVSAEPEGSTPHTCSSRARSARKACSQLSPPAFPPALPLSPFISSTLHGAASHPGENRDKAMGSKGRKGWVWGAQAAKALQAVPSPWHPRQPLLCKPPGRTLEAADKSHLGEEITLLPAMWQVQPVKRKGAVQIPPLTILPGRTLPQRLWHKGSRRDQTTFLTVTIKKNQPAVGCMTKPQGNKTFYAPANKDVA